MVFVGTRKGLELELGEVERAREGEPEGEREREREGEARGEFENSRGDVGGRGLNASLKPDNADCACAGSTISPNITRALTQWRRRRET